MKKIIFTLLALSILSLPSCAWAWGYHGGWHRGYYPGPRIIIAPPIYVTPHCTYYPAIIRFNDVQSAEAWINQMRNFIYEPSIHFVGGFVEVWYSSYDCS